MALTLQKEEIMSIDMSEYGKQEFENIVFLDIDGVLNHHKTRYEYRFIDESVGALNDLYKTHNIEIVLSSSWKNAYSFSFIQKLFQDNVIKAPLIDKTSTFFQNVDNKNCVSLDEIEKEETDVHYSREYEIYCWIKVFQPKHYLILDDYKMQMFGLEEHQVLTSYWGKKEEDMAFRRKHLPECHRILEI